MRADVSRSDESQVPKSYNPSDRDSLLMDPEDQEFAKWAATADREELDEGDALDPDGYLEIDPELEESGLEDGDIAFEEDDEEEEEDEDEDDDDDDEDEDEDDGDEELAARAETDDFDDDLSIERIPQRGERGENTRVAALAGVDEDGNDEIQDEEELMEPIVDDISPMLKQATGARDRDVPLGDDDGDADIPPGEDIDDDDLFGEETDEDIQNAAKILSKSGILGFDSDGNKRYAMDAPKTTGVNLSTSMEDDDFADDLALDDDDSAFDNEAKEGDGLDGYVDMDAYDDDEEFALTSKSSFGRVWELNDDTYVTITEPGEAYVYELDEEDQEDQEMSSMRRGKEGGWSGGLASYNISNLPVGSREWIARRAYELVTQCSQKEMFLWTRRHKAPPSIIANLFPPGPPPPPRLPKTTLKMSTPEKGTPTMGKDSSQEKEPELELSSKVNIGHALDKSISFPCRYRFKAEGVGDDLGNELAIELEKVLGRPIPRSAFQSEPAGKHTRVIVVLEVESALQVTQIFDALRRCPSVKYSYS